MKRKQKEKEARAAEQARRGGGAALDTAAPAVEQDTDDSSDADDDDDDQLPPPKPGFDEYGNPLSEGGVADAVLGSRSRRRAEEELLSSEPDFSEDELGRGSDMHCAEMPFQGAREAVAQGPGAQGTRRRGHASSRQEQAGTVDAPVVRSWSDSKRAKRTVQEDEEYARKLLGF